MGPIWDPWRCRLRQPESVGFQGVGTDLTPTAASSARGSTEVAWQRHPVRIFCRRRARDASGDPKKGSQGGLQHPSDRIRSARPVSVNPDCRIEGRMPAVSIMEKLGDAMRAPVIAAVMVSAMLTGCAETRQVQPFSKAGATQSEFLRDRYACLQQSNMAPATSGGFYEGTGSSRQRWSPAAGCIPRAWA
jgi:hypothetical protein